MLFVLHPTARQLVPRQEAPKSALKPAPKGSEVDWIDQLLPSHCSARVRLDPPLPLTQLPTAVHDVVVAQETSCKTLAMLPDGLGVLCSVQVDPLKRYASVNCWLPLFHPPTAVQMFGDGVQEMSRSVLSVAPTGSVGVWSDQLVPFQNIARLLMELLVV